VLSSFTYLGSGIWNFGDSIQHLGQVSGFATDARNFLNMPVERDGRMTIPSPAARASELRLENVSFTYPGASQPTLDDISLTIPAGETIALVGENGAGKTTLVKVMLGLYQPDSGRILLDGEDMADLDPRRVRRHLSGAFQHFTRYPLPARDNVTLGDHRYDASVERALDLAGLSHLADRLPDGLDTTLSPDLGGSDLSGGQWQRLAIARASIRDASLLALDEPTAALDPLAEVAIFRRFAELARDRTAVLVSHRLGMARLADRIVVLEHGRIIEEGTHDDLVADPTSEYAAMWEAQARWYR
jgi:ABC-type multidrug transport system fused ATPase/permease subunit